MHFNSLGLWQELECCMQGPMRKRQLCGGSVELDQAGMKDLFPAQALSILGGCLYWELQEWIYFTCKYRKDDKN